VPEDFRAEAIGIMADADLLDDDDDDDVRLDHSFLLAFPWLFPGFLTVVGGGSAGSL